MLAVVLRLRLNELKSNESDFWEEASDVKNCVPKGGKSPLGFQHCTNKGKKTESCLTELNKGMNFLYHYKYIRGLASLCDVFYNFVPIIYYEFRWNFNGVLLETTAI